MENANTLKTEAISYLYSKYKRKRYQKVNGASI